MRYRRLSATGDYTFGSNLGDFWIDTPEAVAQSVLTRLMLWRGQWFANTASGTPWQTEVLGERTQSTRDLVVRERVRETVGVSEIAEYDSHLNRDTRHWNASMILNTIFGEVALSAGMLPVDELPALPAPFERALSLGIDPVSETPTISRRADLTTGPQSDIREFIIQKLDAGRF